MKKNKEVVKNVGGYRLYSFTNMYLSSIQKGIQTAHLVGEMSRIYSNTSAESSGASKALSEAFKQWLDQDRTIIVLNGGNCQNLQDISSKIFDIVLGCTLKYPECFFCEDDESLNGAITAYGIVLPSDVWQGTSKHKGDRAIYKIISSYSLAV